MVILEEGFGEWSSPFLDMNVFLSHFHSYRITYVTYVINLSVSSKCLETSEQHLYVVSH